MLQDLTSGSFELHVLGTFGERNLQQSWSPDYFNPFKEKYLAVDELDELAVITHTHTHMHTHTHTHTHKQMSTLLIVYHSQIYLN